MSSLYARSLICFLVLLFCGIITTWVFVFIKARKNQEYYASNYADSDIHQVDDPLLKTMHPSGKENTKADVARVRSTTDDVGKNPAYVEVEETAPGKAQQESKVAAPAYSPSRTSSYSSSVEEETIRLKRHITDTEHPITEYEWYDCLWIGRVKKILEDYKPYHGSTGYLGDANYTLHKSEARAHPRQLLKRNTNYPGVPENDILNFEGPAPPPPSPAPPPPLPQPTSPDGWVFHNNFEKQDWEGIYRNYHDFTQELQGDKYADARRVGKIEGALQYWGSATSFVYNYFKKLRNVEPELLKKPPPKADS